MPKWTIFLISSKVSNSQSKEFVLITEIFSQIFWHDNWRSLIGVVENFRFIVWYFIISEGKNQRQIPKTDNDGFNRFPENGFKPIQNNNFRHHRAGPIHIPNRRIFKVLRVLGGGGRQMKVKLPDILKLSHLKSSM